MATTNLEMTVISGTDKVDFNVLNGNFEKIDSAMSPVKKQKGYLSGFPIANSNFASDTDPKWSGVTFVNSAGTATFAMYFITIKLNTGTSTKWGPTSHPTELWKSADLEIPIAYPKTFKYPPVVNVEWGRTNNTFNTISGPLFTLPAEKRDFRVYCPKIRILTTAQQSNVDVILSVSAMGVLA